MALPSGAAQQKLDIWWVSLLNTSCHRPLKIFKRKLKLINQ